MKQFILVLFLLVSYGCFSQNEQENYQKVVSEFQTSYNASQDENVYAIFDTSLKAFLTLEETSKLLDTVRSNFGRMKKMEFWSIHNSAHVYRTTFEKGVSDLFFTLNDKNFISGFFIPRNSTENASRFERNVTNMIFPFKEEAFVFWGGETVEANYHMADINQQYAYDILMVANGAPYKGDPTKNESYFIFGKDIIAPCDAKVVQVIKGIKDNTPGVLNTTDITGNTLVLETAQKEYLLFAHLKANSILVQEGDFVTQGQSIAQCGNSGNTTQAHLHLQLQNTADIFNSIGAKLYFEELIRNGKIKRQYMPVKEDFIKNTTKTTH